VLLGVPTTLGVWVSHRYPGFAARARRPFQVLSLAFFVLFVVGALLVNWDFFLQYTHRVLLFVFLLNAFALATGYYTAKLARLPEGDRRAVSLEVGIQNSGFGLALVFNFFGGLGGMAIVAAWWGIWHLLAGLTISTWWRRHPPATAGALA
jgi:BASS family bile acid:Na+ symporter